MEKVVFQKNVESAHLIMEATKQDGLQYQFPMLIFNDPEGFLPVSECFEGEKRRLYYDVTGGCPLEAMMFRGRFDRELICALTADLIRALESAGEYLLDGGRISLAPAYIYYRRGHFRFCYIPFKEPDFEGEFKELAAFITDHVDEDDEEAFVTAGQLYKISLEESIDIEALRQAVHGRSQTVADEPEQEVLEEDETLYPEETLPKEEEDPESEFEEFPLWAELFEEPEKKPRRKKRKKREKKKDRSPWGDWSEFIAENG